MQVIKYMKASNFAFCSYLDCRNAIIQTMQRASIDVEYSQGFHPHELLYFSPPTALGIESNCEYVTIFTNDTNFTEKFNLNAPCGLQVLWAKGIDVRPDFYNLIDYAEYEIFLTTNKAIDLTKFQYEFFDEGEQSNISIEKQIFEINYTNGVLKCVVECGQKNNLRISNLIKCLKNSFEVDILKIKKNALFKYENKLINIDELI